MSPRPGPSENWNTVTVTGRYRLTTGAPVTGRLIFTPKVGRAKDVGARTHVVASPIYAPLVEGAFSVDLPATDDPDISPRPYVYVVTEDFRGGSTYEISVPLAYAETGVELLTLAQIVES